MVDKYINEFIQVKENLDVLPHSKKAEIEKYNEYIHENLDKYGKLFDSLTNIIKTRYYDILNMSSNSELDSINDTEINYALLKQINPFSTSMSKMGLDINIFRLNQFYKSDLKVVNKIILDIIDSFNKTGITLTNDDFNYTIYVSDYMKVLLDNSVDSDKIFKTFEEIYWKCPEVINQISLNFYKIYYSHEKEINKFFLTNNTRKDEFIKNYNFLMEKKKNIIHNDKWYLYDRFLDKKLFTKDFSKANVERMKNTYVLDINDTNNYNNLINLESNLSFYQEYMKYQKVIDKMKELYKDKESYKGIFTNKKKDIAKKESELLKLNKKYLSKGFLSPNEKKKEEILLKAQNIITELMGLYAELNDLSIKEKININLSDNSKIPDLLLLVSSDFKFIYSLCKEENKDATIDEAVKFQQSLDKMIHTNDLGIINNINIVDDKNLSQIIVDHYKLLNINLDEEKISDASINALLTELDLLLTSYDIERLGINVEDIEFVINVRKLGIL